MGLSLVPIIFVFSSQLPRSDCKTQFTIKLYSDSVTQPVAVIGEFFPPSDPGEAELCPHN